MPAIQHEGRSYVLKTFKMLCLTCHTLCETSKPYPAMASCECGAVSIDGGISMGATVNGEPFAMKDFSIYRTEDKPKVELPQEFVTRSHDQVRQAMIPRMNSTKSSRGDK
jgi:hypothetical protein